MDRQNYKRIFVLHPWGIGDLVMLLPTLKLLRTALPESKINLGVSPIQKPLAQTLEHKVVDSITVHCDEGKLADMAHLIGDIRQFGTDLLVELSGGYRHTLASYLSSARTVHMSPDLARPFFRNIGGRLPTSGSPHLVEKHLQLLHYLGLPASRINFDFPLSDSAIESAESQITRFDLRGRKIIALVPDSSLAFKNWPSINMEKTIKYLVNDMGCEVVLFGKKQLAELKSKRITDLRGQTDILTDAYLLRHSGLFSVTIGVDTGMMHLAGSVNSEQDGTYIYNTRGNRTVSLFGSTDPAMYKPYDPTNRFNLVVRPAYATF